MKNQSYTICIMFLCFITIEYIYKINIIYYYFDKKFSKTYEEKYRKIYEEEIDTYKEKQRYDTCVRNKIPKISGLLETAQYLRYTNSSIVRFGDGEIDLMEGKDMYFQKADDELARRLRQAFEATFPSYMVAVSNVVNKYYRMAEYQYKWWDKHKRFAEWIIKNANHSRQYFDTLITSPFTCTYNTSCELVDLVYKEMREIWRDKDLVILRGDNREVYKYDVFDTARSQKVYYAIKYNAWTEYEKYKKLLMNEEKDKLFILSIGPTSKVLTYDLVKVGRRGLDLGHLAKDYNCFKMGKFDEGFY